MLAFDAANDRQTNLLQSAYKVALQAAWMGNVHACDLVARMLMRGGTGEHQAREKAYAWALIAAEQRLPHPTTPASKLAAQLTEHERVEGVKISQFFKTRIRRRALQAGEKSFRF